MPHAKLRKTLFNHFQLFQSSEMLIVMDIVCIVDVSVDVDGWAVEELLWIVAPHFDITVRPTQVKYAQVIWLTDYYLR